MDIRTIIRTSAIIYADETSAVSTKTIKKKFIEAVFIQNGNAQLLINALITEIENLFKLSFSEKEIVDVVNKESENFFVKMNEDSDKILIRLSDQRFLFLKDKENDNVFEDFTQLFYDSKQINIPQTKVNDILYKFLYELLNTNISLYSSILKPSEHKPVTLNPKLFTDEEISVINTFLSWDNKEKNIALFKIVSYCIEYALVSNNSSSDSAYLSALKSKEFYLDSNIIYRAIGINGNHRKVRTKVFLDKCSKSGQKLIISKYTREEFHQSVEFHINQLKKIPFGKINPELFKKYNISPSFYEFYHFWRNGRITYGFDSFNAHLLTQYNLLLKEFSIHEEYKVPYDAEKKEIKEIIEKYKEEIQAIKINGYDETHLTDANNCYLIETKRKENNKNIQDTKYYLITTDEKLKKWDENHSIEQPLTLFPNHWMGLILKYVSRTDDDFKSFVSFLKLKKHDNLIDEGTLQIILSGISEITEDFTRQEIIMQNFFERKFSLILQNKGGMSLREEAKAFAKESLEEILVKSDEIHNAEIESLKKLHDNEMTDYKGAVLDYQEKLFIENQISSKEDKLSDIQKSIAKIKKLKISAEERAEDDYSTEKFKLLAIPFSLSLILLICVFLFSWQVMEKITWIIGALIWGLSYLFAGVKSKSFNPEEYFSQVKTKILHRVYKEFLVDLEELSDLLEIKKSLEDELKELKKKTGD